MSIEHMENFAIYGIGGEAHLADGVYSIASCFGIVADPDPSGTGQPVISFNGPFGGYRLRYVYNAQVSTSGVALRMYDVALTNVTPHIIRFLNAAGNKLTYIQLLPTGQLQAVNSQGTVLGTSSLSWKITANAWHHIECKVVFDGAAGSVEIRVNGVQALQVAGVNTIGNQLGPCAMCEISNTDENSNGHGIYMKDWIIWNSLGAHNNDFFGTCQVISLVPNSDTALGAWTLTGAANGYSILATAPPNDTHYLDAAYPGGVGSPAQFGLTDLPIDVTSVRGLQTYVRAAKVDGGDGNLKTSLVSGASTGDGVDRPITSAQTYWKDIFELDPATAAPWTVGGANAVQLKITRTV
jgi:hypothetical protein